MSRLVATDIALPRGLFSFSGQARMDTFSFDLEEVPVDFDRYNDVAIHGLRMAMEAIRRHADEFPFWQRRDRPGRPGTDERTLLVAFMLQQLLDLTFREMEGVLGMAQLYYSIESVPDRSTICRKLSSRRRSTILDRFAKHILASLPRRQAVIATDATGYSGRKRGWNETSHHRRAREDWVKVHAVIEVDEFVVLALSAPVEKLPVPPV